jgi:hypothetical protein
MAKDMTKLSGACSWFGGPNDMGVGDVASTGEVAVLLNGRLVPMGDD